LARDAASRLPDGVGTRADIIELIKHSQWLKYDPADQQTLVTVVSGALDRLHYEDDSCVKYDAEKKLWVYMHRLRTLDYPEWQDNYIGTLRETNPSSSNAQTFKMNISSKLTDNSEHAHMPPTPMPSMIEGEQ
jgi:hypothetical protein